tara:strand:+ start:1791 stop:2027 length:237 start_codon:yes stop_codon:yes gene_type:complete
MVTVSFVCADGKEVQFEKGQRVVNPRTYKDNPKNRRLDRVGQEIPMSLNMLEWRAKVQKGEVERDSKGRIKAATVTSE